MGYKGESFMDCGYFYVPYLDLDGCPMSVKIEDDARRNELVDLVLEQTQQLRMVTLDMTNEERAFFLDALLQGVSAAKSKFDEAVEKGYGKEV